MIADWIHAELVNWSAACKSGAWPHPIPLDRAGSAEGRHIRDSALEKEANQDEQAKRPEKPDMFRAEVVHDVYQTRLAPREKRILVLQFIGVYDGFRYRPLKPEGVQRAMRISGAMYELAYIGAARRVGEAFRSASLGG